jgi:hypothetical protein
MKKRLNYRLILLSAGLFLLLGLFSGCAHKEIVTGCLSGYQYGFFGGLWHGIIAPFDLVGMLFFDDVTMYATNNTGFWYGLGFILGSGAWGILGGHGARRRRKD